VRLPAARLPVGEAGREAAVEHGLDERLRGELVDELVVGARVEHIVETKLLILEVFREIDFRLEYGSAKQCVATYLRLMYDEAILGGNGDDIGLVLDALLLVERSLADADRDAAIIDAVGRLERSALDARAVLPDDQDTRAPTHLIIMRNSQFLSLGS